ncbi:MAG TPA: S8 family serine peptidase, partial [Rubrivivax sp.]|nr:S8 family serine peptidase [Rubrivivax sp.]
MIAAAAPSSWAAGLLLAALSCAAPALAQGSDTAPARGLIVRLKQPLAHEHKARARDAALESARWQRVLGEAGLSGASGRREPRLRPVGRDQQLLEFEAPLSAAQTTALRERLMARPDVEWVEPNRREKRLQATPTDPLFAQQWWLHAAGGSNANALPARLRGVASFQKAWLTAGAAPVVVAVLDTGITSHPDLAGRVLPGHDFVSTVEYANDGNGRDSDASDPGDHVGSADLAKPLFAGCVAENSSWHGTIIAGMLAARSDNGEGGAGMHAAVSVLPVRVAGKCGAELPDIVDGMRWAAGLAVAGVPANPNPARIVNISFGGNAACGPAYQAAVDELRASGVVVVAAAGNDWGAPSRPASCNGVVGVAGLNRDGFKSNYSNFGGALAASGVAAVSGDDADGAWGQVLADSGLVTLTNRGTTSPGAAGYARLYGTSFAAPQVAGAIAHMLSRNPTLTHAQLVHGLRLSARPHVVSPKIAECSTDNPGRCICTAATCGAGIVDAEQALLYAAMPDSYAPPRREPEVIDNADVDAALLLATQDRPPHGAQASGGGGGGGAMGGFWLLALA